VFAEAAFRDLGRPDGGGVERLEDALRHREPGADAGGVLVDEDGLGPELLRDDGGACGVAASVQVLLQGELDQSSALSSISAGSDLADSSA
jgi:hypothetical protein